jgi:hypothetical protein
MPLSQSPEVLKGALVRLEGRGSGVPAQAVVFQYNPETLHRRLDERPDGPPREVITCSLVFDATDALEFPDDNPLVAEHGIYPMLAALELLMHPPEAQGGGPGWRPLWPFGSGSGVEREPVLLFVWGNERSVPVRLTRLDITEEQHDPELRTIRAAVRLRMRVVTDQDLPMSRRGAERWRQHVSRMQTLARGVYAKAPPVHT